MALTATADSFDAGGGASDSEALGLIDQSWNVNRTKENGVEFGAALGVDVPTKDVDYTVSRLRRAAAARNIGLNIQQKDSKTAGNVRIVYRTRTKRAKRSNGNAPATPQTSGK